MAEKDLEEADRKIHQLENENATLNEELKDYR